MYFKILKGDHASTEEDFIFRPSGRKHCKSKEVPGGDKVLTMISKILFFFFPVTHLKLQRVALSFVTLLFVDLRALMAQTGYDASTWLFETLPHPMQTDSSSCGVFALKVSKL